jgi:pimeloyl-ACP methyl ester carboxylesterase
MHERKAFVEINGLLLEYFVYGEGKTCVVCLHGHGRSADDFKFLESTERTVISIHLFYHGSSYFPVERIENAPLKAEEFNELFRRLLQLEQVNDFHLFAFSQGGRFSLCLLPEFSDRIRTLTLIAPDGMDNNSFYNWASRRKWARKLFIRWERNPDKLKYLSYLATKVGIMRPKVRTFVNEFSSNRDHFRRASLTWRGFRELKPDPELVGRIIRDRKIPFRIIMGTHDQVIRPKQAYDFIRRCGLNDVVKEVNNGHNFFKESSINKFIHLLPFMD